MEAQMSFTTENIVYIWLAPLVIYILFPLATLAMYCFWRFVYFMFNPLRSRVKDNVPDVEVGDLEEIA
jgi:hypothetical protein